MWWIVRFEGRRLNFAPPLCAFVMFSPKGAGKPRVSHVVVVSDKVDAKFKFLAS